MKRIWSPDELADQWTITPREGVLITAQKADHTALGFAVLLKYIQIDRRFPRTRHEVPPPAIVHIAQQLNLPPTAFVAYDWDGRTIKLHRTAIRAFLNVHEATVADQQALAAWLVATHIPETRQIPALVEQVKTRCRELHLELPTPDRVERLVRMSVATFDTQLTTQVIARLSVATRERLDALLHERPPTATAISGRGQTLLADLKLDAGALSVQTVKQEKAKLDVIATLELPPDLFAGVSPRLLRQYYQQVATEDIQGLVRHPDARRLTLLAAFCQVRRQEIIDTLAELLLDVVQHLGLKAERRVERDPASFRARPGYAAEVTTAAGRAAPFTPKHFNKSSGCVTICLTVATRLASAGEAIDSIEGADRIPTIEARVQAARVKAATRVGRPFSRSCYLILVICVVLHMSPAERLPLSELERACRHETSRYQRSESSDTRFCLEIFRRAVRLRTLAGARTAPPVYDDEDARAVLVAVYTEFIKRQINRRAVQTTPIDDLIQQVWLRFWRAANAGLNFTSLEEALSYLRRATVSTLLEEQRRERKRQRDPSLQQLVETTGEEALADRGADLFARHSRQRFRMRCREVLTEPLELRVFWMAHALGLPPRDIARDLASEGVRIKDQPPTARAVSDLLARSFKRLETDPEIQDLLRSD